VVEKFGVPVVSTLASKGALADGHDLAVGPVNRYLDGLLADTFMDQVFGDVDLVLLVGYDLAEDVKPVHWTRGRRGITTALVTPVPNPISALVRTDLEVVGSVRQTLAALANADFAGARRPAPAVVSKLQAARRQSGAEPAGGEATVAPEHIVRSARRALGPDGVLVSDIGMHKQYAGLFSETTRPNTFLCSNGLGSFGFGIAAALGAQLACPDRRVVAICGDGGFLSNNQDLETAVRYGLPVVVVILKDGAFGLIKNYQIRGHARVHPPSVDFLATDFVQLARAHGCGALRAESTADVEPAIARALERREPTLVEIPVRYAFPG
jgi:acetolactate synthase-1/2/3 large subunit/N2-(2-carboxyethyl)arginine synthase